MYALLAGSDPCEMVDVAAGVSLHCCEVGVWGCGFGCGFGWECWDLCMGCICGVKVRVSIFFYLMSVMLRSG